MARASASVWQVCKMLVRSVIALPPYSSRPKRHALQATQQELRATITHLHNRAVLVNYLLFCDLITHFYLPPLWACVSLRACGIMGISAAARPLCPILARFGGVLAGLHRGGLFLLSNLLYHICNKVSTLFDNLNKYFLYFFTIARAVFWRVFGVSNRYTFLATRRARWVGGVRRAWPGAGLGCSWRGRGRWPPLGDMRARGAAGVSPPTIRAKTKRPPRAYQPPTYRPTPAENGGYVMAKLAMRKNIAKTKKKLFLTFFEKVAKRLLTMRRYVW